MGEEQEDDQAALQKLYCIEVCTVSNIVFISIMIVARQS